MTALTGQPDYNTELEMRQIQIARTSRKHALPVVELRTPSGRQLP